MKTIQIHTSESVSSLEGVTARYVQAKGKQIEESGGLWRGWACAAIGGGNNRKYVWYKPSETKCKIEVQG